MKFPKVGLLYAVVRASVMFCFGCMGVGGLGEYKLCSVDDMLLWEHVVCVQQVLVFLGIRVFVSSICPLHVCPLSRHAMVPISLTIELSKNIR